MVNMYITLEEAKKHLNIEDDFNEDNAYIQSLIEVAEEVIEKHIDRKLTDYMAQEGKLPTPLLHAIKLYVGNLYANRESLAPVTINEIPLTLTYILDMYRDYNNANI